MDDLLREFLTETAENIATLDVELVNLEQTPDDAALLSSIFRLVHTIKGTCGFLGLPRLESLAHAGENVLGKIRDGELKVSADTVTLILQTIDRIKEILAHLEETETEPEGDDEELKEQLNLLAEGGAPKPAGKKRKVAAPPPAGPVMDAAGFPVAAELLEEVNAALAEGKHAATEEEIRAEMEKERHVEAAVEISAETGELVPHLAAPSKMPVPTVRPSAPVPPASTEEEAQGRGTKESAVAAQTIRVNVELLENLMTLVSELVLTRNQLLQMVRGSGDSEFVAPLQRLSHITTDLQEGVMKTRMQPIGNAWAKLPRIVRDLSLEMGKKIELQMRGAETELDRQVLELIKDPLTHMIRNSADHGLESPKDRLAAGKPEVGLIQLDAYHEGGHIIIEVADDGRGLNLKRIKEKAVMNGLVGENEADSMSDQQLAQFIFRAGLSTAERVTAVSGRGVGMDVVRTNIEKIGGTIELKTQAGRGSTFIIKIPLTLAIVSALIVECAGERFAIPQISVLELVRATENSEHRIERINDAPVLRLRDRLLPLVSLSKVLKLAPAATGDAREMFIVVAQVGTYSFGIIVDRVFDTEEIVVKPVAPILRHIGMFSGNTILGDGSVIMILDPNGIATATGEAVVGGAQAMDAQAGRDVGAEEKTSLLIFRASGQELKTVPLALIARLEEVDLASIEHSHGKPVVQYRGRLMPLVSMDAKLDLSGEGRRPVLVFADRDHTMGLMVDEIVDIIEDHLKIELKADQPGLIGTAIINGKATDVIDAGYYLVQAFGDWFTNASGDMRDVGGKAHRVLLVDDSNFFRNLLAPILSVAGYDVTSVESGFRALQLREGGLYFDAVISDIEMPEMDGFSLAAAIRSDERWGRTPIIALSSHTAEKDFDRGRDAGFDDYVAKFDRDALLAALRAVVVGGGAG